MSTNIGFDDGHPFAEEGADEGVVVEAGDRYAVVVKGEETSRPMAVTVTGGGVLVETPEATLTPFPDMNPVPRVLVDVPVLAFPSGSVTVSLQSTVDGRTIDVRGGQRKPASSPLIVVDPEPGLMVPTSYTVIGFDVDGKVVGSWPVGSVTVEFNGTVIQQPLDPRLSVQVERMWETGRALVRPTAFSVAYPQGRVLPGVVGLGPRRGLADVEWELQTASHEDTDMLQATLGTYDTPQLPIWLIRTPPDVKTPHQTQRVPRRFFCAVELTELDTFRFSGEMVHFKAVTTEVRPPAAGITTAALTWSDVKVFYSTWSELKAAYPTWSDLKRDTSLIGASDGA